MKPIIFMFSGQGSQYYHMGQSLFEQNQLFKSCLLKADKICVDLMGISVVKSMYYKNYAKSHPFTKTSLTHPAIFMIEYALGQLLLEKNIIPSMVLGTSLGEFAASVFANVISFETALMAVIAQSKALEHYCELGGMLSIIDSPDTFDENFAPLAELAAINFSNNFIISGKNQNLQLIEKSLKSKQITYQKINVNHAFHSSLIEPASIHYNFMVKQNVAIPTLPLISTVHAKRLTRVTYKHFWDIIRLPILFKNTIFNLEQQDNYIYLDVGPSGTLANLVKYNLTKNSMSQAITILNPFTDDIENLNKLNSRLL